MAVIRSWLDWTGRSEPEYWAATPAETLRAVKSGQRRRARRFRDLAYTARIGQSTEKNIERFMPVIEDD